MNESAMMPNPLKYFYERVWVPVFGRILMRFVSWIEGKQPKQKPTYDLRDRDN